MRVHIQILERKLETGSLVQPKPRYLLAWSNNFILWEGILLDMVETRGKTTIAALFLTHPHCIIKHNLML